MAAAVLDFDERVRLAALDYVRDRADRAGLVRYPELTAFEFEGARLPLVNRPRGIRRPKGMRAALTILTTYRAPHEPRPYDDAPGPDGLFRYKWQGADPQHPDNVSLREACRYRLPLIWFEGVAKGVYAVHAPVWLMAEEPETRQFVVALDEVQRNLAGPGVVLSADQRRYVARLTRMRLHQPVFRARVLSAYRQCCAMCRLRVPGLLDAAHIIADSQPGGDPVVPNGISLCKIHHAAYDANILGIRPDTHELEVRADILREVDGPMLLHGLQGMQGRLLQLPTRHQDRPDRDRLARRYDEYRAVS